MENIILSATFMLYPKKTIAEVTLSNAVITIKSVSQKSKSNEIISLEDVIGCHVLPGNKTTLSDWYLCIFSYPLRRKLFKGVTRLRLARSLGVACFENENENKSLAEKWKRVIKYLISGKMLTTDQIDNMIDLPPRKFVVYINPFSGRGKAMDIYHSSVKPVFAEADIKHVVIKTEYAGHGRYLAKDLDVNKYDGIVIVSGDGLIHEIINGLMDRCDWRTAIKTPIGVIPGGSGNALAASIVYATTGLHPSSSMLQTSIFLICRGRTKEVDVMSVETHRAGQEGNVTTFYGSLGCIVGLISDVDIESERLRFLGGSLRTSIYAVMRIANLRKYHFQVSYLPIDEANQNFELLNAGDAPPEANGNSKFSALPINNECMKLKNDLLVPLSQPVPSSWQTVQDSFIQVTALNLSHLSGDILIHPNMTLSDGYISLGLMKSTLTRRALVKSWDLIGNGTGLTSSSATGDIMILPCKALRVVPLTKPSEILTLDGERLPYGPFQCQLHEGLVSVFAGA